MKIKNYMKHTKCKNELDLVNHVRSLLPDYDHWEIKVRAHVYSSFVDWWKPTIEEYRNVATIQKEIKDDFRDFTLEDAAMTLLSDYKLPSAPIAIANMIDRSYGIMPLAHYFEYVNLHQFPDTDPVKQAIIEARQMKTIKDIIE